MARILIKDVAREAGVSLGTVSNALNHPDKVSPDTLKAITETIERLGYVPNQAARQLAGGTNRMIGLVLPRLDHAFSLQIANGAQTESRARGYDLLIASTGNDDILENHYMRYFLGAQMAGVLVQPMSSTSWDPVTDAKAIPTVYLDIHARMSGNYIAADNEAQGRLMLEHAIACGCNRVAVIGQVQFMQLTLRVYGIREAARRGDVDIEVIDKGDWNNAEDGYEIGRDLALREAATRPDFVIGLTDVLAAGAIEGIMSCGLDVPRDIRVSGCDGNPLAWGGSVPLTTIESPGFEIGRRGVRRLLSLIGGDEPDEADNLVAPKLLVRTSTVGGKRTDGPYRDVGLNLGEYL